MWEAISPYLTALLPTAGVLVVVYVVFKTIFEADRQERKAVAQWEIAHHRPAGSEAGPEAGPDAGPPAGPPDDRSPRTGTHDDEDSGTAS